MLDDDDDDNDDYVGGNNDHGGDDDGNRLASSNLTMTKMTHHIMTMAKIRIRNLQCHLIQTSRRKSGG